MKKYVLILFSLLILATLSTPASATLVLQSAYQDAALSIDAFGGSSGFISTEMAVDSTILAAYLYSSSIWSSGINPVVLNGTTLTPADGTLLVPNANVTTNYRYDVTSLMTPLINGTWGLQDFSITENGNNDGEVLVVAYSNASTVGNTAIIMDGELSMTGDSTTLNFTTPYAGGDLLMSLADSYSYGNSQFTTVDVTTDSTIDRRLTSAAGGNDDGGFVAADGMLMTAGGIGDNPANPDDPYAHGAAYDDELYNLAMGNVLDPTPFISAGDTFLTLTTFNKSNNDNIFGLFLSSAFTIDQVGDVIIDDGGSNDDPAPVPEPGTIVLLGLGLAALAGRQYRRNKRS